MVTMDHQYEMAYAESNGHVTDDVTWPQKVNVVTPKIFEVPYLLTVQYRCMVIIVHR